METTWRELLGKVISDPQEQQRILETLNINSITLRRWVNGDTHPRPQNLRLLLNAIPQYRKQMLALLMVEFPFINKDSEVRDEIALIPAEFYAQVINAYVGVSQYLRTTTVSSLILQQMLKHMDPLFDGMFVCIAQCVPPAREGQQVRSLRVVAGKGTSLWSNYVEHHPQLFGAELLVGYAVSSGHLIVMQNRFDAMHTFPFDYIDEMESAMAAPIVLANQIVGSIYIVSTQIDQFSQTYLALIQNYIELLCLAFEKEEFYLLSDIALGVMPARELQLPYLMTFQQRVTQQIVMSAREKHVMTHLQAERIVWQQLEEELLVGV